MTTAVATKGNIQTLMESPDVEEQIRRALPPHIPLSRWRRVIVTSIINDPKLLRVDPMKLLRAAMKLAPLGLLTDPLLGEAYLIADGKGEVQTRVGYRGYIKLARQSGEISVIYAEKVHAKDVFKVKRGLDPDLVHEPDVFAEDRGPVVGYYAVAKFQNSEDADFEIMTVKDIHRIRDRSDAYRAFKAKLIKSTPWDTDEDEMAKKTVLLRLRKRLPMSADIAAKLAEVDAEARELEARDITPPTGQVVPIRGPVNSLDSLASALEDMSGAAPDDVADDEVVAPQEATATDTVDPDTGEVTEAPPTAEEAPPKEGSLRQQCVAIRSRIRKAVEAEPEVGRKLLDEAERLWGEIRLTVAEKQPEFATQIAGEIVAAIEKLGRPQAQPELLG